MSHLITPKISLHPSTDETQKYDITKIKQKKTYEINKLFKNKNCVKRYQFMTTNICFALMIGRFLPVQTN